MDADSLSLSRFRLLANCLAGRSLEVRVARMGSASYTDGDVVYVSCNATYENQRREVVVQAALLGAGSLNREMVQGVLGRRKAAARYLALEGRRVLADIAGWLPIVATFGHAGDPITSSASESLVLARSRRAVADPPTWFGEIRPMRLLRTPSAAAGPPTDNDLVQVSTVKGQDIGLDEEPGQTSKLLEHIQSPVASSSLLSKFLNRLLGASSVPGEGQAGAELTIGSIRRATSAGANAHPVPNSLQSNDVAGSLGDASGTLYPEWDVYLNRYRPRWCRAIEVVPASLSQMSSEGADHDEVLRRRLARVGLGPKVMRRRPDGEDLDVDAIIELAVNLRTGDSCSENVYLERRKLSRDLGVLILLDVSGSATDTDPDSLSVHDHQRRAAATLAATLEILGDRVAVYAFRSQSRSAVHLIPVKSFEQRFGADTQAQLNHLEPEGYTRLGAAVRHAVTLTNSGAGTPNRLLLVLSDGVPYDHGYESRYAEADTQKALEEARAGGVACLCLSIGAPTPSDALHRVFGSASHANAPTLGELSPRMDELFLSALRELAVGQVRR